MGERWIELRWRGRCSRCAAELGAGELARFDIETHAISCPDCDARAATAKRAAARRPSLIVDAPHPSEAERQRVKRLIAEARAALHADRHAS